MRLLVAPGSPRARIVRMAVLEKGLDVPAEPVAPRAAAPACRVSTLITEDGAELTETTPILLHLDHVAPTPPLLPLDGADAWRGVGEYAQAIGLMEATVGTEGGADTSLATRFADALEAAVAAGQYAGGAAGWPDAAWIALAVALDACARRGTFPWARNRPALVAWFDAAATRESFVATRPD